MVIVLLFMANLLIGSVPIPASDVFSILMEHEGEKASWSFYCMGVPPASSFDSIALRRCAGSLRTDVADGFQESAGRSVYSGH